MRLRIFSTYLCLSVCTLSVIKLDGKTTSIIKQLTNLSLFQYAVQLLTYIIYVKVKREKFNYVTDRYLVL